MRMGEANRRRLCLCCGTAGATLLRLADGRAYRACSKCMSSCATCLPMLNGAQERDPIRLESAQKQEIL